MNNLTERDYWSSIANTFDEFCDEFRNIKLETEEQAIKARNKDQTFDNGLYWDDPEIEGNVRSWQQIPFNPVHDGLSLQEKRDTALQIAERIRPNIVNKRFSVEFARDWGLFCEYAGQWRMAYLQERPYLNHRHGGARYRKDQHKVWYSKLHVALKQDGDRRGDTDQRILEHIRNVLECNQNPSGFPSKEWIDEIVDFSNNGFRRAVNKMSKRKILEEAQTDDPNLPELGI